MDTPEALNTLYVLLAGSLGMLVLAASVMFIFVLNYRRNIRAREAMYELERKHQQDLIYTNLQTLEDERKRFAGDLHDEIGAALSAIRMHVSRLETEADVAAVRGRIPELKQIIDHSMASTRRISHNMLPPGLDMLGLAHVAGDLGKQIPEGGLRIVVSSAPDLPRLSYNTELALYRVLQELLNNTIRHAQATEVNIELIGDGTSYIISYSDNGRGFDPGRMKYAGLGISNMQNRVKMVNGTFSLHTEPGCGIQVSIHVPLAEHAL